MAIDVQKIADDARKAHEAKQSALAAEEVARQQRQAEKAQKCVVFLKEHVVRALDDAKQAFKGDDISIEIKTDYDVSGFSSKLPEVQAIMSRAAPGRNDGYRNSSVAAHYTCDEESLSVRLERELGGEIGEQKLGAAKGVEIEKLVERSIAELAASFYRAVEKYRC